MLTHESSVSAFANHTDLSISKKVAAHKKRMRRREQVLGPHLSALQRILSYAKKHDIRSVEVLHELLTITEVKKVTAAEMRPTLQFVPTRVSARYAHCAELFAALSRLFEYVRSEDRATLGIYVNLLPALDREQIECANLIVRWHRRNLIPIASTALTN